MNANKVPLGFLFAIMMAIANAGEISDVRPVAAMPHVQVIAYYFHGTVRCETCLKIEKQAREVIQRGFKTDLTTNRLVFKPINYELKENSHFVQDYKLPCPSLVLVRQENGKDVKSQVLGQTWTLVETPAAFDHYIKKELSIFLSELGYGAVEHGTTNSPANSAGQILRAVP